MRPVTHINPETGVVTRSKIRQHSPCGKRAISSKKIAKAEAVRQSKLSGEAIEAYRCWLPGCHCWHLGHHPAPYDRDILLGLKPTARQLRAS